MSEPMTSGCKPSTRADVQRDRILCAALKCFIEHGFHAASMASIAEEAQMSAGLMYRYFENKNAIVLAIVERQLEEKRAAIREMHSSQDHVRLLLDTFEKWRARESGPMSVALFLEMSAEGTRNPQIAEALRNSDALARAEFQAWLSRSKTRGGAGLPEKAAASRALLLRCVIDGVALRAAREPDLDTDLLRAALDELFERVLA
jgi:AcrR family transcriptional regulator